MCVRPPRTASGMPKRARDFPASLTSRAVWRSFLGPRPAPRHQPDATRVPSSLLSLRLSMRQSLSLGCAISSSLPRSRSLWRKLSATISTEGQGLAAGGGGPSTVGIAVIEGGANAEVAQLPAEDFHRADAEIYACQRQ